MPLITPQDILRQSNKFRRSFSKVMMHLLGFNQLNDSYAATAEYLGNDVTAHYLFQHNIKYVVDETNLKNIPEKGSCVFICNHPTGMLDGIVLIDLISRIRPDVKFLGNFLLGRMDVLSNFFIEVDPFDAQNAQNIKGIKVALQHVKAGNCLAMFPAGEVSTVHGLRIQDKKWPNSMMKFIRKVRVPIVPMFMSGKNSLSFHILGFLHPLLRTIQLVRQFNRKDNTIVKVAIGAPILPVRTASLNEKEYADFVRMNVDLLRKTLTKKTDTPKATNIVSAPIAQSQNKDIITEEINRLAENHTLFRQGPFTLLFAHPNELKYVMEEIGRLREITFREVGEGTNKELDIDKYDAYYHQLFIWDHEQETIVGAYRIGMGEEIITRYGRTGFYTNSIFKLGKPLNPVLHKTVELGRSFIIKPYQGNSVALMLLWKGILQVLIQNDAYRYLLGPVSISNDYSDISKTLIERYIKKHHFDYYHSKFVTPIKELPKEKFSFVKSYLKDVNSLELLDKLIIDLENKQRGLPVLVKRYLQLNAKVLAFNIDVDFNDCLDGLILLDLKDVPEKTLKMLSKDMNINVVERFKTLE
ncbi:MAG: lysophospholipid acyltransferase family protein [Bacteroidetes bacterium]|nr:lysophospholipid acyltransferase family protein [Bacteroidota bacterium]MCL1968111.1 lysophospholipid acyltransferase family protein [Bacteroidota bacterium]